MPTLPPNNQTPSQTKGSIPQPRHRVPSWVMVVMAVFLLAIVIGLIRYLAPRPATTTVDNQPKAIKANGHLKATSGKVATPTAVLPIPAQNTAQSRQASSALAYQTTNQIADPIANQAASQTHNASSAMPVQLTPKQQYLVRQLQQQAPNDPHLETKIQHLITETAALTQHGASDTAIAAMRRHYVDDATVQRLAVADKAPEDLLERVNQFEQMREQMLMGQPNRLQSQQALTKLQQQLFSAQEQQQFGLLLPP